MTGALLLRELLLIVLLATLGAGPATLLPGGWDALSRVVFAPVFGLAVAVCALTTANFFTGLEHALWWLLAPLSAGSLALAVIGQRRDSDTRRPRARELVAALIVAVAVAGTANAPLLARQSYGPLAYTVYDGAFYVGAAEAFKTQTNAHPLGLTPQSWQDPRWDDEAWGGSTDLTLRAAWATRYQHSSFATVQATLSGATGWPAWTLITPSLAVLLAIGALAVFVLVRQLVPGAWAAAALAGALYGGPLLHQIYADGSQGMISGLLFVPVVLALTADLLRRGVTRAHIALLGLLFAGVQACYPELLPSAILAGGLLLAGLGIRARRRHTLRGAAVRRAAGAAAGIATLALALAPRTAIWALLYLVNQARGTLFATDGLPPYHMALRELPGWLTGTRDLYDFALGGSSSPLPALLIGTGAIALAGFGVARRRPALLLVAPLIAAAALTAWLAHSTGCGYCEQRSLLSLAPLVPALIGVGLAAAWAAGSRGRLVAGTFAVFLVLAAGSTLARDVHRSTAAAYAPSPLLLNTAATVRALPGHGAVALEGLDTMQAWSVADLPITYAALRSPGHRLALWPEDDAGGTSGLGRRAAMYTPDYDWVVTRLDGVAGGRRTIARFGPYAVQQRVGDFDALVVRGVGTLSVADDPSGKAWVQPPGKRFGFHQGALTIAVAARTSAPAWVRVRLDGPRTLRLHAPGARQWAVPGGIEACVPVAGDGDQRSVSIGVTPSPAILEPYGDRVPQQAFSSLSTRLRSVVASGSCQAATPPV